MTQNSTLFQRIASLERELKQAYLRIDEKGERIEVLTRRVHTLRQRIENKDLRIAAMRREREQATR